MSVFLGLTIREDYKYSSVEGQNTVTHPYIIKMFVYLSGSFGNEFQPQTQIRKSVSFRTGN